MSDMQPQPTTECSEFRRLLELQIDGRLAAPARARLARHVAQCDRCRQTQAELLALNRLLLALSPQRAPDTFTRVVSQRARSAQPRWIRRAQAVGPLPWRALLWEALAAVLVVSLGATWIARSAGWTQLDRTARTATRGVTVLAQQGREAWTPRPVPLADLKTVVVRNYRAYSHAAAAIIESLGDLPLGQGRWLSRSSLMVWGVALIVLLLNLLLEIAPLSSQADADPSRRFTP